MPETSMHRDPMLHPEEVEGAPRPPRAWVKWAMYLAAVALLAGCLWAAWAEIVSGWDKLKAADPGDLTLMAGTVLANIVLNGLIFWAILIPFKPRTPVGVGEMTALIAAASLLNFLPMRAGMIGRAAYLKQRHGVSYAASVVMMLAVAAGTVAIYAWTVIVTAWTGRLNAAWCVALLGGLAVLAAVCVGLIRYALPWTPKGLARYVGDAHDAIEWFNASPFKGGAGVFALLVARAADVWLRACLLWTAARVLGTPIEPHTAVVLATAGMLVTIATPLPNGLGLREWVYGLLAAAGLGGAAMPDGPTGVALGLVERAVEAIVFLVAGSAALVYVHRRSQR